MDEFLKIAPLILLGIGVLIAALQLVLLLRRPRFPMEQRDEFERLDLRQQNRALAARQELAGTLERHFTLLNLQMETVRADSASKLERIRKTVDEQLHTALEQRLGASYKAVSERLEALQKSLGEMNSLTAGVADLRNLLTNVKTRGTWGEIQLGALLEETLTSRQFERNVKPIPGSSAIVEFAIRLPGTSDESPLWLPIDAKFPKEDYERLQSATQAGDTAATESALAALHRRLKDEAKAIAAKYIAPPHTTDFAILFLPTEGLYAEALRAPGLTESIQHQHRILLAGPATLTALLNALQMGFRTLALQERSAEVWQLLAGVRTEFTKFADAFSRLEKKLQEASDAVEQVQVRTRAMDRKLRTIEIDGETDRIE